MESLRRQDTSERLRQAESQLSELRAELEGAQARETQAREKEGQARQAAARSEENARQREQELDEVGSPWLAARLFRYLSLLSSSVSLQPRQRATGQAIKRASRPHPPAPPPRQGAAVRRRWAGE